MDKREQRCVTKFFFLQGKNAMRHLENSIDFSERPLSIWRQFSDGTKAPKRVIFPLMTKTGQGDC
jgi:hypothetical protein